MLQKINKLLPKPLRRTVYAVGIVGFVAAMSIDGDASAVAGYVDQGSEIATALGSLIALLNLRDPGEGAAPAE
ncbi:hypothetical protein GCM10027447_12300 [Glycomyces halotolerans]